MWGGPGILHILQLLFCTILSVRYYTIISLFLDSVHSLRSNKATLHHWETKPNRRFIHRNSQLTCIVQSVTVTLSHKSQLVCYASLPSHSPITILWHLCVPAACLYTDIWEEWRSYCGCLEGANMTAAVSPTFLQLGASHNGSIGMCDV
jgi:hypothetical protein